VARLIGVTRRTVYLRLKNIASTAAGPKTLKGCRLSRGVMPTVLQLAGAISVKIGLPSSSSGYPPRLHRRCWSFLVYLLAVLIFSSVEMAAQVLDDVSPSRGSGAGLLAPRADGVRGRKLALAVELGIRVVAAFPGTWRLAVRSWARPC